MEGVTILKAALLLLVLCAPLCTGRKKKTTRTFEIDYENDQFLKDGEPFRYVSGSVHYFRILPSEWRDRLRKLRMAGFNAVETYAEWASHEPEPGTYDFSGMLDIVTYLQIAQEEDLLVIFRPGPYIDAERDMGGFPYWLLNKNPNMRLRTTDPTYLKYVDTWFGVLLPLVKPLLYENGGPIIMVQVENEYGSYHACDFAYTSHMRDLIRSGLGDNAVLFTTDGAGVGYLKCGKIPYVYSTVDFGAGGDITKPFEAMRLFEPRGPLINSEYYPGWLDHWGSPHSTDAAQTVAKTLDEMLAMNASVNMYMFHGGTSFGLRAGANDNSKYQACPTSYDYDAPVSEAGDPTEKYFAIRDVVKNYLPIPSGKVPPASPKYAYGKVSLTPQGNVFQLASVLQSVSNKWPLTFEQLMMPNGVVMYETVLPFRISDPALLTISDVHDRAYVFVDTIYVGTVAREQQLFSLPLSALPNQTITIIVESQGRVCFGSGINDFKGLTTNVTVNGNSLANWRMVPIPLTNTTRFNSALLRMKRRVAAQDFSRHELFGTQRGGMTLYQGSFTVPQNSSHPQDTFLRLDGWGKGVVWVNDFCLGRYWPDVGPQETLYVPRGILKNGANTMLVMELEKSPCQTDSNCYVRLQDTHVIDGPTPN